MLACIEALPVLTSKFIHRLFRHFNDGVEICIDTLNQWFARPIAPSQGAVENILLQFQICLT
ncbi:MAG: hypothetical protein CFE38_14330 [Comamonadaceae bacterium PBBC1]|nr:MAG: hypothetical protein CFE38_14330 [Comamonadaceae bacterium PBBC1]